MQSPTKWSNNKKLLIELAQNFKLLQQQNTQLRKIAQSKINGISAFSSSATPSKTNPQNNNTNYNNNNYSKDQQKILKLYSYKTWHQFMGWIDEKLEESGENADEQKQGSEIKRVLSQILEQPDFQQSYTLDRPENQNQQKKQSKQNKNTNLYEETEVELLAVQNAKLRRENIQLKSKLLEIKALYEKKQHI